MLSLKIRNQVKLANYQKQTRTKYIIRYLKDFKVNIYKVDLKMSSHDEDSLVRKLLNAMENFCFPNT